MTNNNVLKLNTPDHPLQEVLREGAHEMLATAIEAEVADFLKQHGSLKTDEGKPAVVRNGYLPERAIQTGLGERQCIGKTSQSHAAQGQRSIAQYLASRNT